MSMVDKLRQGLSPTQVYSPAARRLQAQSPELFGAGSTCKLNGITRQDVRSIYRAHQTKDDIDKRGRPPALPHAAIKVILAVLAAVVAHQAYATTLQHFYNLWLLPRSSALAMASCCMAHPLSLKMARQGLEGSSQAKTGFADA